MSTLILTEHVGNIQIMTINRPEVRNAINFAAAEALAAALDALDANPDVVLGILTGAAQTFCSGMDLKDFSRTGKRPYVGARGFAGICQRPPAKPLIAAVEGFALAGGCEIALACDLIVAADNACFGLPEVKRGLVPGSGGMLRLPARIPYHVAMQLVLTGEIFAAQRAWGLGLVNQLAPAGLALEAAIEMGQTIAANGPLAVQTAKRVIQQSRDWKQDDMFEQQRPLVEPVFASEDAREGAAAFVEKREPVWKGK